MKSAPILLLAMIGAVAFAGAPAALAAPLDFALVLPPAPAAGSPRDAADRAIFKKTRALAGSPRWVMAQGDANLALAALLEDFSCAVGARLDLDSAPATAALLRRLAPDIAQAVAPAKLFYRRRRPYLVDKGPICVPRSDTLDRDFDYPSGHATASWTAGLLLAMAAPDRAETILGRARAFGESRVVCGVHNASAVEAGRLLGAAIVARHAGDADLAADLARARGELVSLRAAQAANPARCAAEAPLLPTPY